MIRSVTTNVSHRSTLDLLPYDPYVGVWKAFVKKVGGALQAEGSELAVVFVGYHVLIERLNVSLCEQLEHSVRRDVFMYIYVRSYCDTNREVDDVLGGVLSGHTDDVVFVAPIAVDEQHFGCRECSFFLLVLVMVMKELCDCYRRRRRGGVVFFFWFGAHYC